MIDTTNIIYPTHKIIGKERNKEFLILWMLLNNSNCGWRDFLDKRLEISQSSLSNNLRKLGDNNYIKKIEKIIEGRKKKLYEITEAGKLRYEEILVKKKTQERPINYPPDKYLLLGDNEINILYMLHNNPSCRWKDFLNTSFKINQSVLSRILKFFESQNLVEKVKDEDSRFDVYQITEKGTSEYIARLKSYKLDRQSILDEQSKSILEILETSKDLFNSFEIPNDNVKFRLLNNILTIDTTKLQGISCSDDDFKKIIYFISLNHPEEYPNYTNPENFSKKHKIDLITLKFFLNEIVDKNLYGATFFKLIITSNKVYYFQAGEEFEKILRAIIINAIKKIGFLGVENEIEKTKEKPLNLVRIQKEVIEKLNKGYFHNSLKNPLINFLPDYIEYLKFKIEKKEIIKSPRDRLKGFAFRDISVNSRKKSQNIIDDKTPELEQESNRYLINTSDKKKKEEYLQIALDDIDNVIRTKPQKIENYHRKVDLLIEFRRYEEALETIDRAIILSNVFIGTENKDDSYFYKAKIQRKLSHYEEALNAINKTIEINPNWYYYFNKKADYLRLMKRYEEGLIVIEKAISDSPDKSDNWQLKSLIYKSLKKYSDAIKAINQAIKVLSDWWGHYSVKGDILMEMGEYKNAISPITQAIKLNPSIISIYSDLAYCYSRLGKFKNAIETLDRAIEQSQDDWDLFNFKKEIYIEMKDYDAALQVVDSMSKIYQDEEILSRVDVLMELEEFDECLKLINKGIEKHYDEYLYYNYKAKILKKLERYEESFDVYKKSLEMDFNFDTMSDIINVMRILKRDDGIVSFIDEFLKKETNLQHKIKFHILKFGYFYNSDNYTDALNEIDRIIEIEPQELIYFLVRANVLRKINKFKMAFKEIDKAIKLGPNEHLNYYGYGKIHFDLKEYNKAIKSFKKGLNISYNYKKKYKYYIRLGKCYNLIADEEKSLKYLKQGLDLADFENDDKWKNKAEMIINKIKSVSEVF